MGRRKGGRQYRKQFVLLNNGPVNFVMRLPPQEMHAQKVGGRAGRDRPFD